MRADPSRNSLDFATLKDPPAKNAFVILDADKLETFSVWLRLVIAGVLNALYLRGGEGLRTLFMLSEFTQHGHLKPIMTALGQIADMTSSCSRYRRTSTGFARATSRMRWRSVVLCLHDAGASADDRQ